MLLPLLTVIAIVISGISFVAILSTGDGDRRKPAQPAIFPDKQVSLWSFVLFLFCPTESALSTPKQLTNER